MKKVFLSLMCIAAITRLTAQSHISPKAIELVSKMSVEDKAGLVVGLGMNVPGFPAVMQGPEGLGFYEKVPGAAGNTKPFPTLGVPSMILSDGPAGVRINSTRDKEPGKTFYATAWPVATLLASTWNTPLVKQMGADYGAEARDYGIDVMLGPALNLHRNPLGGRNFEYFSEDPLISGNMTAALVNGIQSQGVGTSIKHFAANDEETSRNLMNCIMSERAMREIYLKGFEIAVKQAQPWTIMSSYNLLNGKYTSQNPDLLNTILRKEWGFKGLVVTDWYSGNSAVEQMKAGNDLLMAGRGYEKKAIIEAVKNGQLDEKILTENAVRVMNIILKTHSYNKYAFSNKPDLVQHAQMSKTVAEDGMVLLKNEANTLPFTAKDKRIALFGIHSYDLIAGGTGSGDVNKAYTITLAKGIADAGLSVDANVEKAYQDYLKVEQAKHPKKSMFEEFFNPTPPIVEKESDNELTQNAALESDIAVICIGKNAGEGRDRQVVDDYNLTANEQTLIKSVSDIYHAQRKKVVVVLNIGGVIDVASWRNQVDAILLAWQPGLEGGHAMTNLLNGTSNPSGKLATTFAMKYEDVPSSTNFPGKELKDQTPSQSFGIKTYPSEVVYQEGVYVGYRYYDTYAVAPAYEFGYGQSYTTFEFSDLKLSKTNFKKKIVVTCMVKNTGKVAGKEVAQFYLGAPTNVIDKPEKELKGFVKTELLQPGASQKVSFEINASDLASFNTNQTAWVADAGEYNVRIGSSSRAIKLEGKFNLAKSIVVEKVNKVIAPDRDINEFKGKK